jgi:hypothetical protein
LDKVSDRASAARLKMAFEHIIDDLKSVPEALRSHYQPHDGKHRLIIEDVSGLKSALDRTKAELKEWKGAAREHNLTAADIGKLVNSNAELLETRAKLRIVQCDSAVSLALMKAKATATGAELLAEHLAKRVTIETVEGRDVFRITKDGKPMAGSGSDGLATFEDLLKETIEKFPELFLGENRGGGGAPGSRGGHGRGSKVLTRAEFDAIPPRDRAAKIVKEGFTVVDT